MTANQQVVVLGAGMAGAACARMLARSGVRPVMIARGAAVANRGETLSGRAAAFLDALGWADLLDAETAEPVGDRYSVWGGPRLQRASPTPELPGGWHIDRERLETRMLERLAGDGFERITGDAVRFTRTGKSVGIELASGERLTAAAVADCTGRASATSPAGTRRRMDRLTACHATFNLPPDVETAAATLIEAVDLGWWYTSTLPGRRMAVALFSDSDLLPGGASRDPDVWARLATGTSAIRQRLDSLGLALDAARPDVAPAATVISERMVEGRIVRAGDAGAALDPLASNGLATALWSGIEAARAILGLLRGDPAPAAAYETEFLGGILSHLNSQRAFYAAEFRFADNTFWRRRNGSDDIGTGPGNGRE